MKKFLCLFLSVVLFSFSFSFVSLRSASASFSADFAIDTVLNYVKSSINSYTDSQCKKIAAARTFYFYIILNDVFKSGKSVFDDSGTKFSADILNFYYEQYNLALKGSDVYNSDGDIFLQAAGFSNTPWKLSLCHFNVDIDKVAAYFENMQPAYFKSYYQTLLARYLLAQGGTATDPNPGKTGLEIAPGYTTGADLKEAVTTDNSIFYPKNASGKMSYRTDKQNQLSPHFTAMYGPTLYEKGFTAVGGGDEIYLIGFYFDGEKYYYSKNQYHLYIESEEVWMEDRDEIDYIKKTLYVDSWSNMDGSPDKLIDDHLQLYDMTNLPYMYMYPYSGFSMQLRFHENYTAYIKTVPYYDISWSSGYYDSWDTTYTVEISTFNSYLHFTSTHDTDCNCNADIGYIASLSPIKTVYDVDTSKIPDDAVITVGGDNIYNYYITNPDTGESSTMSEYITNNYTYITNNNGGEGSGSSGGVGGNVNVSGDITVGGEVGVDINVSVPDININVNNNGGSGAGGTEVTPNPDDFLDNSQVDLTSYYDKAVEDASGVRQFLGVFFDFLPAELLGLLCLLVAVAICCRIFGR